MKSRLLLAVFLGLSLFVFLAGGCQRMEAPKESQPESKEAQKMEKPSAVDSPTEGGEPLPSDVVSPDDGLELSAMQQLMKDAAPKDGKNGYHWIRQVSQTVVDEQGETVFTYDEDILVRAYQVRSRYDNLRVTQDGKPHESKAAAFMRGQVQIRDFQANRFIVLNENDKTWFAQPMDKPFPAQSLAMQGYAPTGETKNVLGLPCEVWDRVELIPNSKRITRACWSKKLDTPIVLGMPHLVSADGFTMALVLDMTIQSLDGQQDQVAYKETTILIETTQVSDAVMVQPPEFKEITLDDYRNAIPKDGPFPFRQ